ncbi:MauE/DoxX family redox-associated membrane protein [Streptomyces sp. NPDC056244]|uniref:MauE/DoxX family redox-associated membrane protein n=1 Tax=Streptomyces sp. NPDC056244 TaxID=3345762 RepID=UPI0035E331A9
MLDGRHELQSQRRRHRRQSLRSTLLLHADLRDLLRRHLADKAGRWKPRLLSAGLADSLFHRQLSAENEDRERSLELLLAFSKLSLISLFGVSAAMKARDLTPLVTHITLTMPLSNRPARMLALATVAAESLAVVALFVFPLLGFIVSLVLLACFTVHLSRVVASGVATSCACAGSSESTVSAVHVVRNAILIGVALAGIASMSFRPAASVAIQLTVAGPAMLFGAGMLWLDEITRFFSPRYSRSS